MPLYLFIQKYFRKITHCQSKYCTSKLFAVSTLWLMFCFCIASCDKNSCKKQKKTFGLLLLHFYLMNIPTLNLCTECSIWKVTKVKVFGNETLPFETPYFQAKLLSIHGNISRICKNFRSLLTQSQAPHQTHTGFVNVSQVESFYLCDFQTEHPVQREHYFVRNKGTFRLCVTLLL